MNKASVKNDYVIRNALIASLIVLFFSGCSVFGIRTTAEPEYIVIQQQGDIQLREYSDYLVAETTVTGSFSEAGDEAFRRLFGYITGENQGERKIDMTAPVLARSDNKDSGKKIEMTTPVVASPVNNGWTFAFVLPTGYTLDNAPIPASPEISLASVDSQRVAVIEYTGSWNESLFLKQSKKLYSWINQVQLNPISEPRVAAYDPPWTLPFLRRNEVLIEVEPESWYRDSAVPGELVMTDSLLQSESHGKRSTLRPLVNLKPVEGLKAAKLLPHWVDIDYDVIFSLACCVSILSFLKNWSRMRSATNISVNTNNLRVSEARINICNLRLRTYIGFNPEEKAKQQDVIINAEICYRADPVFDSDDEGDALNYKLITKRMIQHIEQGRFHLLEKLTADLLTIATESERVSFAEVKVDKPHALRFADSVSVTLSATRE